VIWTGLRVPSATSVPAYLPHTGQISRALLTALSSSAHCLRRHPRFKYLVGHHYAHQRFYHHASVPLNPLSVHSCFLSLTCSVISSAAPLYPSLTLGRLSVCEAQSKRTGFMGKLYPCRFHAVRHQRSPLNDSLCFKRSRLRLLAVVASKLLGKRS
jgi:hypothetical protein